MPPCGWRPFLGENRGGCPLTPDVLGRRRPLISRVLGAARGPFTVALSTRIRFAFCPAAPAGDRPLVVEHREAGGREETQETEEIIQRVAALDIGKAELTCCVRVPSPGKRGRRAQEVRTYQTMTRSLLVMADPAGRVGRDPGGHGGHQRLLEGPRAPRGSTCPGGGGRTPPAVCRSRPLKLGQPDPGGAGEGGSSPDNDGTGQDCQMAWVRQARREGVSRAEPVVTPP